MSRLHPLFSRYQTQPLPAISETRTCNPVRVVGELLEGINLDSNQVNDSAFGPTWTPVFTQSIYKSLALEHDDTVRLLTIYHGDGHDPLEGSLHCTRLSEVEGCYDALSYTWGDAVKTQFITLNGQDFEIGSVIYQFLRAMRNSNRSILLWTDAICINQASDSEKGHQVRMMGQIYARANRTLAWLGEELEDAEALRIIGSMISEDVEKGSTYTTKEGIEDQYYDPYRNYERYGQALRRIGQHKYWTRAWIYQELILASTIEICCRDLTIPWTPLSDLASIVDNILLNNEPRVFQEILWSIRNEKERDLYDLLEFSSVSGCSIPRDRIFALFSLITDFNDPLFLDWSQSRERKGQISARARQLVDYAISSDELFVKIVHLYCERGEPWDRTDFAMPLFKALDLHKRCFLYPYTNILDIYANIFEVDLKRRQEEWLFSFPSFSSPRKVTGELYFVFAVSVSRPYRIKAVEASHGGQSEIFKEIADCWDSHVRNSLSAITSPILGSEVDIRWPSTKNGSRSGTLKLTLEWLRVICKLNDVAAQYECKGCFQAVVDKFLTLIMETCS